MRTSFTWWCWTCTCPRSRASTSSPEIRQTSPLSRVIMMSGYADKSAAISALRGGALDFLEKPLSRELFVHSVNRALEVLEKDLELRRARNELERTNLELRHQKSALEQMKLQLIETNEALSVLARNLDTARVESERRTALMAKSLLLPIVQRLRNNAALAGCDGDLELLSQHIRDLTANVGQDNKIITTLSRSELRVAALVRNGMTNEEIAEHLNVSTFTVKTHRRNIRRNSNSTMPTSTSAPISPTIWPKKRHGRDEGISIIKKLFGTRLRPAIVFGKTADPCVGFRFERAVCDTPKA